MTDTKGGFLASMIPSALWGTGVPRDPSSLLTWHPLGTPNWRTQRIQRGERRGPRKRPRIFRGWKWGPAVRARAGDSARSRLQRSPLFPTPAEETAEPTHSRESSCGQTLPLFKFLTSTLFQNPTHRILDKTGSWEPAQGQGLVENELRAGWLPFGQERVFVTS